MLHTTWAVHSLSHRWGYRTFETADDSRNNILCGILVHGDGWHNNHHAHPHLANHGVRWWEIDTAFWAICLLEKLGLAWDVKRDETQPVTAADDVTQRVSSQTESAA